MPTTAWRRALAVALVAAAATACQPPRAPRPRVVVIGLDGADWRVIDRLAAEGRLPHLAALRERGTSGSIRTLADLPISPAIWTSVATGKAPARHGVTWFLVDAPDGSRVPVRSDNRRVRALWNIAASQGLSAAVVGWWATWPAEPVGPGVIVSDAVGFHGFGRTAREDDRQERTYPADLFPKVDALMPPVQQVPVGFARRFLHLDAETYHALRFDPARAERPDPGNPVHLFQQYAVTAQGYAAIAEHLLETRSDDLLLVYFEQIDSLSHLFMKHAPPKLDWVGAEDFERYRDVVPEWYAYQDELLGRLLERIDLESTAVFVLSDHGFKSGDRRIRSEREVDLRTAHLDHEPDGIFVAAGPGIRRGARIEGATVLDVTPTVLHYLGLPVGKDMDGVVLEELLEPERRARQPLRYVATWEEGRSAPSGASEPARAELDAHVEALRTLGYVAGGGMGEAPDRSDAPDSSPEIHNNLGTALIGAGDLDGARAEFRAALELDPHDADAWLNLALIARMRGNDRLAAHLVEQALRADPNHAVALAQLAELTREAGHLDESIRLYREAIALDDVDPGLHLGYGDVLQRSGRYDEARAAFLRVLELSPDSFPAHYDLGVTALQQARLEEAIHHFTRALEIDPDHPLAGAALNNLGTVHLEMGESERAVAWFERAVAQSPAPVEAYYNLASQYLDAGRVDEAIGLLEEATRLAPNHELVNAKLGLAYLVAGSGPEAYRALTVVRRLHPDNWFAPLGLAALHAANGRVEQARPLLADALRLGGADARAEAASYPALQPLLVPDTGGREP